MIPQRFLEALPAIQRAVAPRRAGPGGPGGRPPMIALEIDMVISERPSGVAAIRAKSSQDNFDPMTRSRSRPMTPVMPSRGGPAQARTSGAKLGGGAPRRRGSAQSARRTRVSARLEGGESSLGPLLGEWKRGQDRLELRIRPRTGGHGSPRETQRVSARGARGDCPHDRLPDASRDPARYPGRSQALPGCVSSDGESGPRGVSFSRRSSLCLRRPTMSLATRCTQGAVDLALDPGAGSLARGRPAGRQESHGGPRRGLPRLLPGLPRILARVSAGMSWSSPPIGVRPGSSSATSRAARRRAHARGPRWSGGLPKRSICRTGSRSRSTRRASAPSEAIPSVPRSSTKWPSG